MAGVVIGTGMKALRTAALAGVVALGLAGCAGGPNAQIGTLGGAAAGGLIGSQFGHGNGKLAATGAGVLLGGLIGNNVGTSLDRANSAYYYNEPPPPPPPPTYYYAPPPSYYYYPAPSYYYYGRPWHHHWHDWD